MKHCSLVQLAPLWLHCLLVRLHAWIVPGDTEQDTGEAEWVQWIQWYSGTVDTGEAGWGNCHFHMRGKRGENQTIEVFKYFKLSHEGREREGENQTIDA